MPRKSWTIPSLLALSLCGLLPVSADDGADALSAGIFTSQDQSNAAYTITTGALGEEQLGWVSAGRRMFNEPWVLPTEYTGVWGLGPTFNENGCAQCHPSNGRARAPESGGEVAKGLLLRLSVPGVNTEGGPNPHPIYGDQFQNRGVKNLVPAEGRAVVNYEMQRVALDDGEVIELRRPIFHFSEFGFGPLGDDTMMSPRIAPSLIGLGLLEAVPEEDIVALAQRGSAQGMKGVPNYVWDIETQSARLGRFGWKANQPTLRQQTAAAFHGDIGATSSLFPAENCPEAQVACRNGPTATGCGGGRGKCEEKNYWEVLPSRLRNVTLYLQALAVPARRQVKDPNVIRGESLFTQARCDACHVRELKTASQAAIPSAVNQPIRPYTDLLLHDMGEALADNRPDFKANGRQWRTAPLWGLGLQPVVNGHIDLLHDGRARNFLEAILWHGGEAAPAREAFMRMSKADRQALISFLSSL